MTGPEDPPPAGGSELSAGPQTSTAEEKRDNDETSRGGVGKQRQAGNGRMLAGSPASSPRGRS